MPLDIRAYRVFVASPGGLHDERKAFRDAIEVYNQAEAIPRGVLFIPVGWEDTLGGFGRPQSLINEELRECDFLVLVLWDRWGTPPGDDGGHFTSGTEEEFTVAQQALRDSNAPMQQIVVLFKGVDPKQLSDPGQQLSRVLAFRKQLETDKELLYQSFDSLERFAALLSRHLGAWLRAHERRSAPITEFSPEILSSFELIREPDSLEKTGTAELDEAWNLANNGRRTEAETIFSKAIVRADDPRSFLNFGRFLNQDGRLDQAMVMFEQAMNLAQWVGSEEILTEALNEIGEFYRTRGEVAVAEECFRNALVLAQKQGNLYGMVNCLSSLALLLRNRGDLTGAETMLKEALGIAEQLPDPEGVANVSGNIGLVLEIRGDLAGAEEMYRKALEIHLQQEALIGVSTGYGNLGNVLRARGDLDGAEAMHRKALEIDEQMGHVEGMAIQLGNIGIVLEERGDLNGAEEMHRKSLEIETRLGRLEGMASDYGNIGNVLYRRGDLAGAEEMHRRSLELEERLGRIEGIGLSYISLGEIARDQGKGEVSRDLYKRARAIFEQLGNSDRQADVNTRLEELGKGVPPAEVEAS